MQIKQRQASVMQIQQRQAMGMSIKRAHEITATITQSKIMELKL